MKKHHICLLASAWLLGGPSLQAAVYSWGFGSGDLSTDQGNGTMTYAGGTAAHTTFGVTNGTDVPHIAGQPASYLSHPAWPGAANDPGLGYHLTFQDSGPNGGGSYINQYTLVFDVLFPGSTGWTPLFQTDPSNGSGNDADFYVDASGAIGIGGILGYSPSAVITPDTWHRIAFAADLGSGNVRYFVDGVKVFERNGDSLLDGRLALYSNVDDGPDLLLSNENDTSGNYTHAAIFSDIAFVDRPLSDGELMALGKASAAGIFPIPEPSSLGLLLLSLTAARRRRR